MRPSSIDTPVPCGILTMKHLLTLIALSSAGLLLTTAPAQAQSKTTAHPRSAPAATSQATVPNAAPAPATPGDTHVHRLFQAWGRGMDRAGSALEKVPKPDQRWPGNARTQRPPDTSPTGNPYSSP